MMKVLLIFILLIAVSPVRQLFSQQTADVPFIIVLGNVQDAGSPHIACGKECCKKLFSHPDPTRKVVSLGLVDPQNQKNFIFEATPDFPAQVKQLKKHSAFKAGELPDGIFLSHAHIGHYTGLMYLGKEAVNASAVPIYAMPKMKIFLENNGPWSQLLHIKNIVIQEMQDELEIRLTSNLSVIPFTVPHRDEYSETVGFKICGPKRSALFIPDIDKWSKWEKDIVEEISTVDYAFLDATFYDGNEINTRDISEVPHPFVVESMNLFGDLSPVQKAKVYFIHFNHTNPLLNQSSQQSKKIVQNGFRIAHYLDIYTM